MGFTYINENECIKIINKYDRFTNLKGPEAQELEYKILTRLNNNFKCMCKKKKENHFPIVKKKVKDYGLLLSYCGKCLKFGKQKFDAQGGPPGYFYNKEQDEIDDIPEQIDCIIHNLKRNNIIQIDEGFMGQNLTIKNKTLYMIDFGMAFESDKKIPFTSEHVKNFMSSLQMKHYYKYLKILLIWIMKNNKLFHEKYKNNKRGFVGLGRKQIIDKLEREISPR
tara:strand:+ start:1534 stop:2202 length:669 start_codon:yes stop_codon:yes gene_type:complete